MDEPKQKPTYTISTITTEPSDVPMTMAAEIPINCYSRVTCTQGGEVLYDGPITDEIKKFLGLT